MLNDMSSATIKNSWCNLLTPYRNFYMKEHMVQFYDGDSAITKSATQFAVDTLISGEGLVLLATKHHAEAIARLIGVCGINLELLQNEGKIIILDATELLSQFVKNETFNEVRFLDLMGRLLKNMQLRSPKIRIFDEMVNLLCETSNFTAALALENLWKVLTNIHRASLLCGHNVANFENQTAAYRKICHLHTHVFHN